MKLICVGRNYVDHAKELNNPVPEAPVLFMKPDTALLKSPAKFYYPDFSNDIHFEAELVLKISKQGKHIDQQFAHRYYDEITVGIDFTARDIQSACKSKSLPWEIAKAFDQSAVTGEWLPKTDFNLSGAGIQFSLMKNGQSVQNGNTKDMLFHFDYLISYISTYFSLKKGDLIFTGTPAGVGPVKKGDLLEGFIEKKKVMDCKIL